MSYLFPNSTKSTRTGKQDRQNMDRFFHIMNEGWYLYMRRDAGLSAYKQYQNGIAGPFASKAMAAEFLQDLIEDKSAFESHADEKAINKSEEDWRY